ncbi:TetR/AcrR family transcriptional regulator [Saccharomonospora sp. NPDC046836]|uniref:TetR/AcrR family transcriptional regulator n=1 Tax=Saccharomonospora sp. NPDC046836 TaxID=3156921 RepID=UPI0033D470B6
MAFIVRYPTTAINSHWIPVSTYRKRPRQQRSRDMVEYMLEAAARIFERDGIDATTNRIAAQAGVSIGSLYQYFPDKHSLLHELALRHLDEVETTVADVFTPEYSDLRALVEAVVAGAVRLHEQRGDLHRMMREHAPRTPQLTARFTEVMGELHDRFAKALADDGVEDASGRACLAITTIDAQVHAVLAGTKEAAEREARMALVVEQVLTVAR